MGKTANGRDEPEATGGSRCILVCEGGRMRAFKARCIFDASVRVFWNNVLGCETAFPVLKQSDERTAHVRVRRRFFFGNSHPTVRGRLAGGRRSVSLTSFSFFLSSASKR